MSGQIKGAVVWFVIGALFIVAALVNSVGVSPWWLLAVAAVFLTVGVRYLVRGLRSSSE
jgi:membrane protein implicated in regulation of membrane protease activity